MRKSVYIWSRGLEHFFNPRNRHPFTFGCLRGLISHTVRSTVYASSSSRDTRKWESRLLFMFRTVWRQCCGLHAVTRNGTVCTCTIPSVRGVMNNSTAVLLYYSRPTVLLIKLLYCTLFCPKKRTSKEVPFKNRRRLKHSSTMDTLRVSCNRVHCCTLLVRAKEYTHERYCKCTVTTAPLDVPAGLLCGGRVHDDGCSATHNWRRYCRWHCFALTV